MVWLLACESARGPREASEVVDYTGWIYAGPTSQEATFAGGAATFTFDDPEVEPVEAEEPYPDDYPGYWNAEVPGGERYTLRLEQEGYYPAIWRGTTPTNPGGWFAGALVAGEIEQVDSFLGSLS